MNNLQLLIASASTVHGSKYLEYLKPELIKHFQGINTLLFIPFAQPGGIDYNSYTALAQSFFEQIGIGVTGIHKHKDAAMAVRKAEAIFVGGGNSFVLLNELYKLLLLDPIREVLLDGIPYLGTSAGSNILGPSIMTTNDMPIVYPPSFDALNLIPFQINPHYSMPNQETRHMGETRDTRIKEYLKFNNKTVVGLQEASYFILNNGKLELKGDLSAYIFQTAKSFEVNPNQDFQFLMSEI